MKKFLVTSLLTLTIQAFAGGSGGGGVMSRTGHGNLISVGNGSGIVVKEYVKYLGNDRGELVLEYGQVNQRDEFYTEKFKL